MLCAEWDPGGKCPDQAVGSMGPAFHRTLCPVPVALPTAQVMRSLQRALEAEFGVRNQMCEP